MSASAALGPLIAAELPRQAAFAARLTRSREDARDLMQDTAVLALRGAWSFQPGTDLAAWLRTIMRNHYATRRRIERRRAHLSPMLLAGVPLHAWGGQEAATMLREVLALCRRLPAHYRDALFRTAAGDMLHEIAHATGRPVGSVKSSVSRARSMLTHMVERGR